MSLSIDHEEVKHQEMIEVKQDKILSPTSFTYVATKKVPNHIVASFERPNTV